MQLDKMKKERRAKPQSKKRQVLGKGLDALIPAETFEETAPSGYLECDIDLIHPNRYQPRSRFNEDDMRDLADSIRAQGIIQPLLVTRSEDGYELVAGERRLRAARMAGLKKVPTVVKEVADSDLLEMSLVENIQRDDLNAMEEADAYHRLTTEFGLTQEQAAQRVGKSRSTVANFLRLRQLPGEIKASIVEKKLSMGHARALLGLETTAQQQAAWRMVMAKKLSVRETERLVSRMQKQSAAPPARGPRAPLEKYLRDIADDLSHHFGTRVEIKRRGKKGKVQIEFYSDDDLNRLIELLRTR
jgi:ParB family chromosome partitioning protein